MFRVKTSPADIVFQSDILERRVFLVDMFRREKSAAFFFWCPDISNRCGTVLNYQQY